MNDKSIDFDDINTWPQNISDYIESNINDIHLYYETEQNDWEYYIKYRIRKENIYKTKYDCILNEIDNLLQNKKFIVYHCSRLIPEEIIQISNDWISSNSIIK